MPIRVGKPGLDFLAVRIYDMEVTCCGEVLKTPFCPLCGRPAALEHPLLQLLAHVRSLQVSQKKIERFDSWVKALEEVVKEKGL
jgi:hypothetical protein